MSLPCQLQKLSGEDSKEGLGEILETTLSMISQEH